MGWGRSKLSPPCQILLINFNARSSKIQLSSSLSPRIFSLSTLFYTCVSHGIFNSPSSACFIASQTLARLSFPSFDLLRKNISIDRSQPSLQR